MKVSRLIWIVTLAVFYSQPSHADTASDNSPVAKNAFGGSLGWVVGNGMTYRRYIGDGYAQGTFIAYIDRDANKNLLDMAISGGYYLHTTDWKGKFFPTALKLVGGVEAEANADEDINGVAAKSDYYHIGAGVGLEVGSPRQEGFTVSLELNYTASLRGFEKAELRRLFPLPAASIYYNW